MSEKTMIRTMPNKMLLYNVNRLRKEKADPATYGKNGTSRWITTSEFWSGHHTDLKKELKRRQEAGTISSSAGKSRKSKPQGLYGGMNWW